MKPQPSQSLLSRIEHLTGQKIAQIKSEPLSEKRRRIELAANKDSGFIRHYPLVGRGCVLGDRIVSKREIEEAIDTRLSKTL